MHDLLLRGGTVYDGLGSPGATADVAVRGARISAVGSSLGPARRAIDVSGLAVTPGFIDPHSHSDLLPLLSEPQPFKLLQGVTTEIVGNCGFSPAPLSEVAAEEMAGTFEALGGGVRAEPGDFDSFVARLERAGPTNNLALLVGHNTLRLTANGMERHLCDEALARMCDLADAAFAAGAVGLSSGLIYVPGAYSDTDELIALARVAHRWHRPYTTHMRDESRALGSALDEAIDIGRRARVPVQVSHCKAAGIASHGGSTMLLDKLHQARVEGVDVRGDQYPYLAGSTMLAALLPPSALEGGTAALQGRLAHDEERASLRALAEDETRASGAGLWREAGAGDVLVVAHKSDEHVGRTLEQIAGRRDPWGVTCDLVAADPAAMMVITLMDERDVRTIMADPLIAIGSDNGPPLGLGHPRTWGCFPHFLGRYVRELGVVNLAEAVRKLTSSSACQFRLTGRGHLSPGAVGDVCVFDPAIVGHGGTYLSPDPAPAGIAHVLLAGEPVVLDGEFCGDRRGRVLRGGV